MTNESTKSVTKRSIKIQLNDILEGSKLKKRKLTKRATRPDFLLQAKEKVEKANLVCLHAFDELQNFWKTFEVSEKDRVAAQTDFEDKTLNYSLAIQKLDQLEQQQNLSKSDLLAARQAFNRAKNNYQSAQGNKEKQEERQQSILRYVMNAHAYYNQTKSAFEYAKASYKRVLLESKQTNLIVEDDNDKSENIDFLMSFLKQHPVSEDGQSNSSQRFKSKRTGHVTWEFNVETDEG
ncbi:hypothetical protein FACS1894193_08610 [Bacilli bacterium]|nr:hypothetical protein FACS1894192_00260 [Bacilli bacterium]GHU42750.1 hypothetical protein FACS1894193_08610 [Bacilli bacterium]GHU46715.1 hypothetical protein FACS1894194_4480 [Bacilli bacterium]